MSKREALRIAFAAIGRGALKEQAGEIAEGFYDRAQTTGLRLQRFAEGEARRTLGDVVDISVGRKAAKGFVEGFASEQVTKLEGLMQSTLEAVSRTLSDATISDETIEGAIVDRLEGAIGRAEQSAEMSTAQGMSELNHIYQVSSGVDSYVWTTMHDDRVRPSHEEMDGEVCDWGEPPDVDGEPAHPGEQPGCRCSPFPVLPESSGEEET